MTRVDGEGRWARFRQAVEEIVDRIKDGGEIETPKKVTPPAADEASRYEPACINGCQKSVGEAVLPMGIDPAALKPPSVSTKTRA